MKLQLFNSALLVAFAALSTSSYAVKLEDDASTLTQASTEVDTGSEGEFLGGLMN